MEGRAAGVFDGDAEAVVVLLDQEIFQEGRVAPRDDTGLLPRTVNDADAAAVVDAEINVVQGFIAVGFPGNVRVAHDRFVHSFILLFRGPFLPEQDADGYAKEIGNDGKQGDVGVSHARFPHLKILVMYECLRPFA